jgi:2'-5' RNA ligase
VCVGINQRDAPTLRRDDYAVEWGVRGAPLAAVASVLQPSAKPHHSHMVASLSLSLLSSPRRRVIIMAAPTARLPAHLTYKTALALLPPAAITPAIESVRRVHDRHFERWPPHINLIYPFRVSPSETTEQGIRLKSDMRARIEAVATTFQPFRVSLSADPPGTFVHSPRSRTVWMGPSSESLQRLQAALQSEFAECDADRRPYTPHLTLGQARNDHEVHQLSEEIKRSILSNAETQEDLPLALDWLVDKVYVIERKGYRDRFKIVGAVDLGNNDTPSV